MILEDELCHNILKAHSGFGGWYRGPVEENRVKYWHNADQLQEAIFEVMGDSLYLSINGNAAIVGLDLEMVTRLYNKPVEGMMPPMVGF